MDEANDLVDEEIRKRLAARGIDIEESYAAFDHELRTGDVPIPLLRALERAPVLEERTLELFRRTRGLASSLTELEIDTLVAIAEGMTDAEIARRQGVSAWTMKTRVRCVLSKLEARNRAAAVSIGYRTGLL